MRLTVSKIPLQPSPQDWHPGHSVEGGLQECLVAATGIQSVMAYAGVAQASDGGMEVYEGRRIPLAYWGHLGRGLSPPPFIFQADSNSWKHRFLDCPASAALTKEK
jgi:hypothetical protein